MRAVAPLGGRQVGVDHQRLAEHVADLLARIERAVGVLEDDLHLAAHLLGQRRRLAMSTLLPSMKSSPPVGGIDHA